MTMPRSKTLTICGHDLTLTAGRRYRASCPAYPSPDDRYPVTVVDLETGDVVGCFQDLTLPEATDFINAFNNGRISLTGRLW
jgi:hypothetical protein